MMIWTKLSEQPIAGRSVLTRFESAKKFFELRGDVRAFKTYCDIRMKKPNLVAAVKSTAMGLYGVERDLPH